MEDAFFVPFILSCPHRIRLDQTKQMITSLRRTYIHTALKKHNKTMSKI